MSNLSKETREKILNVTGGKVNEYFGIKKKKVKFFFENNNFKPI